MTKSRAEAEPTRIDISSAFAVKVCNTPSGSRPHVYLTLSKQYLADGLHLDCRDYVFVNRRTRTSGLCVLNTRYGARPETCDARACSFLDWSMKVAFQVSVTTCR